MDEYIDRESLIKRFCERCNEEMSDSPCEPSDCFAREVIKTIPFSDVAPVVHGWWIIDSAGGKIACSDCGCIYLGYNGRLKPNYCPNYCPNCGAKMDGGAD